MTVMSPGLAEAVPFLRGGPIPHNLNKTRYVTIGKEDRDGSLVGHEQWDPHLFWGEKFSLNVYLTFTKVLSLKSILHKPVG